MSCQIGSILVAPQLFHAQWGRRFPAVVVTLLAQHPLPKPPYQLWHDSIKHHFRVDPLLDEFGTPMNWVLIFVIPACAKRLTEVATVRMALYHRAIEQVQAVEGRGDGSRFREPTA